MGISLWAEPRLITCLGPKSLKSVSNSEFHADSEIPLNALDAVFSQNIAYSVFFSYKNGKIAILTSDTV